MNRRFPAATALWLMLVCAAAWIVAHARYSADLSAFLPQSPTAAQRLLVEQLHEGIASRLIMVAVEGADPTTRARISSGIARQLRAEQRFTAVENGDQHGIERDRAYLFDHRYVLSDAVTPAHFSVEGLRESVQSSLDLLASPAGLLTKALLTRDPTGELVQILDQLGEGHNPRTLAGVWSSQDGKRAILVARTRASGSDTDAQQQAIGAIRGAYDNASAGLSADKRAKLSLQMSGPGVFSVAARSGIEREVLRLSLLSTALIVALLLAVYRSAAALILGLVPVFSGALAGVAAVALGFGVVHGITLGFGITLIGESVDYSIYLFIQTRRGAAHTASPGLRSPLWGTIGLGVLTSVCGFAVLLPSGFPGLAQLGLYSVAGLIVAALVTRFVLPRWLPRHLSIRDVEPLGVSLATLLSRVRGAPVILALLAVAAIGVLGSHRGTLWNHELSALSPVSRADQQLDAHLRADLGAPDVRVLVVITGAAAEEVLQATERVGRSLQPLVDSGALGGFESPARFLPSEATQQRRRESIPPAPELQGRLEQALAGLPLRPGRLTPFVQDIEAARRHPPLTRQDLAGTSLAAGYDSMLSGSGNRWTAILPLRAAVSAGVYHDIDVKQVNAAVSAAAPGSAVALDLKHETDELYSTYLTQIVRLSLFGLGAIVLLLLIALRSPVRVLRVVAPLVLAVLVVAAGLVLAGQELTILHVIGMLLIVAVGSNYALFFDRRATDRQGEAVPLTLASLVIANAATVAGFGVLATSSVPVMSDLGSTVAPGALLALLFSALLARRLPVPTRAAG